MTALSDILLDSITKALHSEGLYYTRTDDADGSYNISVGDLPVTVLVGTDITIFHWGADWPDNRHTIHPADPNCVSKTIQLIKEINDNNTRTA